MNVQRFKALIQPPILLIYFRYSHTKSAQRSIFEKRYFWAESILSTAYDDSKFCSMTALDPMTQQFTGVKCCVIKVSLPSSVIGVNKKDSIFEMDHSRPLYPLYLSFQNIFQTVVSK